MQLSASSSVEEVAAIVSDALTLAGITAVLSGGAAVQIYTSGLYESRDLDFVASASQRELEQVLTRLGFTREAGRHFVHKLCPYTLEFPAWPLAVGNELVREWGERPVGALIGAIGRGSIRRSWSPHSRLSISMRSSVGQRGRGTPKPIGSSLPV